METKKKRYSLRLEESFYETYREASKYLIYAGASFEENYFHNAFYFETLEDAKRAYDILEKEEFTLQPIMEVPKFETPEEEILDKYHKGYTLETNELEYLLFGNDERTEDFEILRQRIEKSKTKQIYKSIIEVGKEKLSIIWWIDKWRDYHYKQPVEVDNYSLTINEKHYFRVPDYLNEQER